MLQNQPLQASECLHTALHLAQKIGRRRLIAIAFKHLSELLKSQKQFKRSKTHYLMKLEIAQHDKFLTIECNILIGLTILLQNKDKSQAMHFSQQAVSIAQSIDNPTLLTKANAIASSLS